MKPHTRGLAAALTVGLTAGALTFGMLRSAEAAPIGAGSYATTRPAGASAPVACPGVSANPRTYVTANAPAGAVPTNDWWSSLLYKRDNVGCQYSAPLHAHPMSFQPEAGGLGVSYTTDAAISGTATGVGEYHYPYTRSSPSASSA